MNDINVIDGEIVKKGDTGPPIRAQLIYDGTTKDLTGFTVELYLRHTQDDTVIVSGGSATIEEVKNGVVEYNWSAGETDSTGIYEGEFVIDDGNQRLTFPNDGYFNMVIEDTIQ